MSVKDIHVILGEDALSVRTGIDLARRFEGHVTALAVEEQPELTHYVEEARAVIKDRLRAACERFEESATQAGVPFSILSVTVPPSGNIAEILRQCRVSDLIVVDQSPASQPLRAELVHQLLLDSAAPVLVVPHAGTDVPHYDRAVIAWDGRPVAAHAIQAALPLLGLAQSVVILTVTGRERPTGDGADLAMHLEKHGISAVVRDLSAVGSVAETLLGFVSTEQIDWITMGAFGRSRLHDMVFGSPTREMLAEASVPVLMHH